MGIWLCVNVCMYDSTCMCGSLCVYDCICMYVCYIYICCSISICGSISVWLYVYMGACTSANVEGGEGVTNMRMYVPKGSRVDVKGK